MPHPAHGFPQRGPAAASRAFAASGLLRQAMGNLLHSTLLASQEAEQRRVAALDEEELIASSRWYPLVPI